MSNEPLKNKTINIETVTTPQGSMGNYISVLDLISAVNWLKDEIKKIDDCGACQVEGFEGCIKQEILEKIDEAFKDVLK